MKVYRFRSIDYLLGDEYQELEKQTIYFASPDELNDPMEGLRDIVWRGDEIVWTNLFKNYVWFCHATSLLSGITDDSEELDTKKMAIPGRWSERPTPQMQRLFEDIWHRFLRLPKIAEIFEALASTNRKIRYRELEFYLRIIQLAFSIDTLESEVAQESFSELEKQQIVESLHAPHERLESMLQLLTSLEQAETETEIDDMFRESTTLFYNEKIHWQLNSSTFTGHLRNIPQLFFDLPSTYLDKIETLLWPNWYTACFMQDFHNSSVWGNYGAKHEGTCLMFETVESNGSNNFQLYKMIGEDVKTRLPKITIPLSKVSYADKPAEVDFFRSMGGLEVHKLILLWYTDENNNMSQCANHLLHDEDKFKWEDNYWDSFYRNITTKTKDWEYEQEYRLILRDDLNEFNKEKSRTLIYDFNSLKGIIFGIKTSDENRLRIIKIIQRKCRENNRMDFKFYQAYYSPETGDIRKYEIQLA